eukprot:5456364-Prymnesium_polylepis.1
MPIRRLTRTPALSAASLSTLLAPYGGAMRTEAHKSVGSTPNCRGNVSMTNRRDTSAHMRANGVYGRTVPSAEGTLESSPAA